MVEGVGGNGGSRGVAYRPLRSIKYFGSRAIDLDALRDRISPGISKDITQVIFPNFPTLRPL